MIQTPTKTKQTAIPWLGKIPEGWEVIKLKWSLDSLQSGGRNSGSEKLEEGAFSVGGEHIGWRGELLLSNKRFISYDYFDQLNQGKIDINDVLLVKDGATIGKSSIIKEKPFEKMAVNEHVFILRPNKKFTSDYLFYYIFSPLGQDQIALEIRGSAQPGLNSQFVNKNYIPLPPLQTQKNIANYLDDKTAKIKKLIDDKKKMIELLKEQKQSIIHEAVTKGIEKDVKMKDSGIAWLGEIPEGWEVRRLKVLSDIKRGASPRPIADKKYFDDNGEFAWVRIADVTANNIYLERTTQQLSELGASLSVKQYPGDLFLSIAGTVGKPMFAKIKCCIHDGFVTFSNLTDKINKMFLFYILNSGQAYFGLGKEGSQLLQTQKTIVDHIEKESNKINTAITKTEQEIELIEEYKKSLVYHAVTGKIAKLI